MPPCQLEKLNPVLLPSRTRTRIPYKGRRRLQGEFDFRNFCKIDPAVSNFRRTVLSASIQPAAGGPCVPEGSESPLDVFEFEVRGTAFLYHQARHRRWQVVAAVGGR